MKRLLIPVLLLAALTMPACGSTESPAEGGDPENPGTNRGTTVPPCPFTAAKVTEVIGQSMNDDGNCLFGDGKGVASLTVTMASETAGAITYHYQREQAGKRFERVTEANKGDKGYIGVKAIEGEAVVLSGKGAYTLTLSSFSKDTVWYEQTLRKLLDTVPV